MALNRALRHDGVRAALIDKVASAVEQAPKDPVARAIFDRHGLELLRQDVFSPVPLPGEVGSAFFESTSELVGVDADREALFQFAESVVAGCRSEFERSVPLYRSGGAELHLLNGSFMAVDAEVLYGVVRRFTPQRVVEVGAGYSTLLTAAAVLRNERDGRAAATVTAIDPYPLPFLNGIPGLTNLVVSPVQDVALDLFSSLGRDDIVFLDSTHVLRAGGDVAFEYLEVLPRLQEGVLVHVHDIYLPRPYPRTFLEDALYFFNEQYLLQAFLAFNPRFEILWAAGLALHEDRHRVQALSSGYSEMKRMYPALEPSSVWLRVRGPGG